MMATVLALGLVAAGVALILLGRRLQFVLILLVVLLFQNVALMLLLKAGLVTESGARVLTATKELLLLGGLLALAGIRFGRVVLTGRARRAVIPTLVFAWFALVAVHALAFGEPWLARLAGARAVLILPALYLLGYWLALSWRDTGRLIQVLVVVGVLMAAFGFVEAYLLPDTFWLDIGHEEFYLQKIDRPVQDALYANMRFWFNGQPIRRVASITGDPLISSYPMALVLVLVVAFFVYRARLHVTHPVLFVVVGAATLLTLSRGAVLTVLVAGCLVFLGKRSGRGLAWVTAVLLLGLVVATTLFGDAILRVTTGAGHIDELVQGLQRGVERPLGFGLGTASSLATGVARSSDIGGIVLGGGDSYMGSLATQMGLPAVVAFYALMLLMIADLARHSVRLSRGRHPNAWWFGAVAAMLAGLLVTSAVNESGFGFVASGATYVLAGTLAHLGVSRARVAVRVEAAARIPRGLGVADA